MTGNNPRDPQYEASPESSESEPTLGDGGVRVDVRDLQRVMRMPVLVPSLGPGADPGPEHDRAVVDALYRRAVGGSKWEDRVTKSGNVVRVESEVLPDPAAARKWLEARQPETWGEKTTQEFRVVVARLGPGSERVAVGLSADGVQIGVQAEAEGGRAAIEGQVVLPHGGGDGKL